MKYFMRKGFTICFGTLMAAAIAAPVAAAEALSIEQIAVAEIEVNRGAEELQAVLRPRPDLDIVNTVLIFNNALRTTTVVQCAAFGHNGRPLGRAKLKVPGNGLRFLLASDLANGRDFIGSAICKAEGKVVPSAFIVGRGLTDTKAKSRFNWPGTRMRFPAVVTY